MAVPKMQVYAVLRSSPEPLTFPAIVVLCHRQTGSRDSLQQFHQMEEPSIREALDELTNEGMIHARFVEALVYEVQE